MLIVPGSPGVRLRRWVSFPPTRRRVVLVRKVISLFLVDAVIRTRLVGCRAPGRLHRSAGADEVDTANCHVFLNASLAPVILFRRRLHSVGAVLEGIRQSGLSIARWRALMLRWAAVDPWRDWLLPDLHGFYKWVFDSIDEL